MDRGAVDRWEHGIARVYRAGVSPGVSRQRYAPSALAIHLADAVGPRKPCVQAVKKCAPPGIRTQNLRIKSPIPYVYGV